MMQEAALALGISESTVRGYYLKARQSCREWVQP